MSTANSDTNMVSAASRQYEYMDEEHSDECMDDATNKYEYMDEEHSDECMDDATNIYEEHSDDTITTIIKTKGQAKDKK
jgi:hypothetical protein